MGNFISSIQPIAKMALSKIGETEESTESSAPFLNVLKDAVSEYASKQEIADADNQALALGESDNLAQIQINTLEAETALQTTVQLTSRVVNAYKEIMQMSV
ncbi:MAG: flagellar hook-basal body complex protein FliE [Firmicutes bacterium HGW-Firmicutes-16]|nr:MAG: flagellar hook-basal body complex protein FliE [Firmicutes bacterium HGW-Firmicutes-16]